MFTCPVFIRTGHYFLIKELAENIFKGFPLLPSRSRVYLITTVSPLVPTESLSLLQTLSRGIKKNLDWPSRNMIGRGFGMDRCSKWCVIYGLFPINDGHVNQMQLLWKIFHLTRQVSSRAARTE